MTKERILEKINIIIDFMDHALDDEAYDKLVALKDELESSIDDEVLGYYGSQESSSNDA